MENINIKISDEDSVPIAANVAFYILGMSVYLPWNFFITADSFWQYKLRNVSLGDDWNLPGTPSTFLQISVTPGFVVISHLFYLFFTFAAMGVTRRIGEKKRIVGSLLLCLFAMAIFTVLAIIDTDNGQVAFYGAIMLLTALLFVGNAILQTSLYGAVGIFSAKCMTSLISGHSLAGVVSSLAQIISLAIGSADPTVSGIIYFTFADAFIILSVVTYLNLIKTEFYRKNADKMASINGKCEVKRSSVTLKEHIQIFKKIGWMAFTLGLVVLIALSVFPAVQVYVSSTHYGTLWGDVYFQPTITFLVFNVMDMIGREAAVIVQWPGQRGMLLHVIGMSRIAFIPLILLCYGHNKSFPTVFYQDFYYIIINFFFALTNGYLTGLTMIYYPRFVAKEETDIAGALMSTTMGVGMIVGSALSPALVATWGPKT